MKNVIFYLFIFFFEDPVDKNGPPGSPNGPFGPFLSPTVLRTEGDLQVDHLCVCMFLTTLLLVDITDTGFSLVDFNEALEIMYLSGRCNTSFPASLKSTNEKQVSVVSTNNRVVRNTHTNDQLVGGPCL